MCAIVLLQFHVSTGNFHCFEHSVKQSIYECCFTCCFLVWSLDCQTYSPPSLATHPPQKKGKKQPLISQWGLYCFRLAQKIMRVCLTMNVCLFCSLFFSERWRLCEIFEILSDDNFAEFACFHTSVVTKVSLVKGLSEKQNSKFCVA